MTNNKNKTKRGLFLSLFMVLFLISLLGAAPAKALRAEIDWPTVPGVTEQITDGAGNLNNNFGLNDLVKYVFNFLMLLGGLAAFFMIVKGGVMWLTSTGSPAKTTEAKEQITSALIGLLLLLGSYIILKTLNPDLLILKEFNP